jgi:Carboxypeptidase regulatory-like domain
MKNRIVFFAVFLALANTTLFGADRVTLTGKVTDTSGSPVVHATVIVYHAGVRQGYSDLCPSCYADCGKRSTTDEAGNYTIKNLDPDLWFELLLVRDGYAPAFLKRVEPSKGPAATAFLQRRNTAMNPKGIVRGRVVDAHGTPLRDAVVETQGIAIKPHHSLYGPKKGLDPLAVTNVKGEFEISYDRPAYEIMVAVEARTMAQKFVVFHTGSKRQTVVLSEGAAIRGRLVADGMPVSGAEIGLYGQERGGFGSDLNIVGSPYSEIRVGTQEDGSFTITNVPSPGRWYVYAKMASVADRGATVPSECVTTRDNEVVEVGALKINPAHRFRGQVVLSDGGNIPAGTRVLLSAERGWDFQTALLGKDGDFEFIGIPTGKYFVSLSVKGYEMPNAPEGLETVIDRDLNGLLITLIPSDQRHSVPSRL